MCAQIDVGDKTYYHDKDGQFVSQSCKDNAIGMVMNGKFMGLFEDNIYYIVDGKVAIIHVKDVFICNSDTSEEIRAYWNYRD